MDHTQHPHTHSHEEEPSSLHHTKLHTNATLHLKDVQKLTKKAGLSLKEIFEETSLQEKIVIIASTLGIILTLLPWASSKSIHISGVSHFMYMIGLILLGTFLYTIIATIGNLYGKRWFGFFGSLSKMHMLMGVQMVQLSLIAFTIFHGFISLSTLITEVDSNMTFLMVAGLAVLGSGIYENAYEESKKNKKMVIAHLRQEQAEEEHELHSLLKKHHE